MVLDQFNRLQRADMADRGDMTLFSRQVGELVVIRASRGGSERAVVDLLDELNVEIDAHKATISEREQRVFQDFLLADLSEHLRDRMRLAEALIEAQNEALARCSTSSGMTVTLRWSRARTK